MVALMKKLIARRKAALRHRRPETDGKDTLRLLERILSDYLPEAEAERTTDDRGQPALKLRVTGRPNWILTPSAGLRSLAAHPAADGPAEMIAIGTPKAARSSRGCRLSWWSAWRDSHGRGSQAA
jgi:hypothetical protein